MVTSSFLSSPIESGRKLENEMKLNLILRNCVGKITLEITVLQRTNAIFIGQELSMKLQKY